MNSVFLPFIAIFKRKVIGKLAPPLITVILTTCSSTAPPAMENISWIQHQQQLQQLDVWQLRGRVDVRYNNDSHTPRIQWQQQQSEYHIRLWGTFNAGNTTIDGRPGYVSLEQDGNVVTASTAEDLILLQLGYELPVSYLEYWIRGLPAPDSSADLSFNELNQLSLMVQDGWTVSYPDPRQYGSFTLPRRVDVTRPRDDVRLRFFGLNWVVDENLN